MICRQHHSQLTSEPVIFHNLQFAICNMLFEVCNLKFVFCNHLIGLEWFNRDWLDADIALPYTKALVLLLSLLNCFVIVFVFLFIYYLLFIYLFILYFHLSCAPLPVQFPAIGTQPLATIIFYSFFVMPALITWLSHFGLKHRLIPQY